MSWHHQPGPCPASLGYKIAQTEWPRCNPSTLPRGNIVLRGCSSRGYSSDLIKLSYGRAWVQWIDIIITSVNVKPYPSIIQIRHYVPLSHLGSPVISNTRYALRIIKIERSPRGTSGPSQTTRAMSFGGWTMLTSWLMAHLRLSDISDSFISLQAMQSMYTFHDANSASHHSMLSCDLDYSTTILNQVRMISTMLTELTEHAKCYLGNVI